MKIEKISTTNLEPLTYLKLELWPECSFDEEYANCQRILQTPAETCYLIKEQDNYIAFIQLSLRTNYVEGANSSPVAYVEGIYVQPEFQRSGIGKKLIARGEKWARKKGCTQFASDAELHNDDSIWFHKKTGFKEVSRIVSFIKEISR